MAAGRSVVELASVGPTSSSSSSPSHDNRRHHGAIEPHLHTATLDMLLTVCLAGGVGGGVVGSLLGFAPRGAIALTLEAEQYERRRRLLNEADDDAHAWRPEDGAERTILTIVGITLFGFAVSSILVGIWTWRGKEVGGAMEGAGGGAIWGLVAFCCLFFSPAYGLPPELPGMGECARGVAVSFANFYLQAEAVSFEDIDRERITRPPSPSTRS